MNLYLISQTEKKGFDVYDSVVVATETENEARSIHPHLSCDTGKTIDWNGTSEEDRFYESDNWCSKEFVKVKLIGKAVDGLSGIVCASFNAG